MVYGDPEFLPFNEPDRIKYYKYAPNSYVTINGRDLNRVCRERDVIGKSGVVVVVVGSSLITDNFSRVHATL